MAKSVREVLERRYVNPLFGLPKQKGVDIPQSTPSNMWLVRIDDQGNQVESLRIQTVPLEISVEPESNWAVIPSVGRNNPFYQYTGGEDTLAFTLDWYSVENQREDVIRKCRWVQSLARADGYVKGPPRVLLIYGDLFRFATWIVDSAAYRLSLFDKERGMLPRQAYQDLVLKRVTEMNLSTQDFREDNRIKFI